MMEKHGIRLLNADGSLLVEIGSHIVQEAPPFAEKIGVIAACWAQVEVHLNCLFAVFLNVTPEQAASQLRKYKTAALAAKATRQIAKDNLADEELRIVNDILDRVDAIRPRRNRLQHDVWARKGDSDDKLFAVHANQYLEFTAKVLELTESALSDSNKGSRIISLGKTFATEMTASYTVQDLQLLQFELDDLSKDLMSAMFVRLLARKNESPFPP